MSKVLITRQIPQRFIDSLQEVADVTVFPEVLKPMSREEFLLTAKNMDVVITMLSDVVDQEFFERCPNVKAVINLAVGYDNIDLSAAAKHKVIVCNTPDVLTETTAELAFTLMLVTARRIVEAAQVVQNKQWVGWSPYLLAGKDVYNQTVGIFGMGAIGSAFARRCQGFNMKVLYHNRSRKIEAEEQLGAQYVSFEELLQQSDFIICTAPLTDETQGRFNQSAFRQMKNDAIFINIGRGGHVIEQDLLEAIQTKEILAAGLDVVAKEPIDSNHPFLQEKNIVILPHIGSATVDTRDEMIELCIDNTKLIISGQAPLTPVQ